MGGMSIWHWLVVGGIALLLFGGKGKISDIMGDVAKGIKSFKKGMADEEEKTADADPKTIEEKTTAKAGETEPAKESQKAS